MVTAAELRSVPLFAGLPLEHAATLARSVCVKRFSRSAYVLRAGEPAEGLYVILKGSARVLIPDEEGREVVLATLGPLEFFGEMGTLDDLPRSASVQTLERSEVMYVAKAEFLRCVAENRELAMSVMRGLVRRLRSADRQIESLALMDVYGRVARVLLDLAEDVDGSRVIPKAPPKQEIAHMVGASREMVSRVMRGLQRAGLISMSKRRIVLIDRSLERRREVPRRQQRAVLVSRAAR